MPPALSPPDSKKGNELDMENAREGLSSALKVLSAMTAGRAVNPSDVQTICELTSLPADARLDDIACDVAQQALACRAHLRAATPGTENAKG